MNAYFCTSFCNFAHNRRNGFPLNHGCYVLPPAALKAEAEGGYEDAIQKIQEAKPLRTHGGTRCRHKYRKITVYGGLAFSPYIRDYRILCAKCDAEKYPVMDPVTFELIYEL